MKWLLSKQPLPHGRGSDQSPDRGSDQSPDRGSDQSPDREGGVATLPPESPCPL
jgi:hypothetical protein